MAKFVSYQLKMWTSTKDEQTQTHNLQSYIFHHRDLVCDLPVLHFQCNRVGMLRISRKSLCESLYRERVYIDICSFTSDDLANTSDVNSSPVMALTCSNVLCRWRCASDGVIFHSVIRRSILFNTRTGRMFSSQACLKTACVCMQTTTANISIPWKNSNILLKFN